MNFQLREKAAPPIVTKVDHDLECKTSLEVWQVDENHEDFVVLFLSCLTDELKARIAFLSEGIKSAPPSGAISPRASAVLDVIATSPNATAKTLAVALGIPKRQAQRVLRELREDRLIRREGSNRSGRWIIHRP